MGKSHVLLACLLISIVFYSVSSRQKNESAARMFLDDFSGPSLQYDPRGIDGWSFFTGDGRARMTLTVSGEGYATITVDASDDKLGIWWALIKRCVSRTMNLALLRDPHYEFRIEARIRVSDAPKRVNLHLNTQRTTDFHTHLMEFDIPDTVSWHIISMTTQNFDAGPGDTVFGQLALMDWGFEQYRVDIDYFKVSIVHVDSIGPDQGVQVPYHPPLPNFESMSHHIPVLEAATVDTIYTDTNFSSWYCADNEHHSDLLVVGDSKIVLLRWDVSTLKGKQVRGPGVLELTTHAIQRLSDRTRDFGILRVCEIIGGQEQWDSRTVTYESWKNQAPFARVVNSQMIIDVPVTEQRGGKTYCTLSNPVLQRLLDTRTKGIALRALGLLHVTFFKDSVNRPVLHCTVDQ
ncbi:MAG: hypothetical protein N3A63_08020 [Bacteroidetes bacterium]|nr:hypothetical protein [Bacteroidota bacterium]